MTRRTAVRRSAVLGLGAVGTLLLAAPASALEAGSAVQAVTDPVAGVVDPLTAPLQGQVPDPLAPVVEAAPAPVGQVAEAVTGAPAPAGDSGPTPVTPPPSGDGAAAPQQTGAPAPAAASAPSTAAAAATGGTGVASMPSGFTASTAGLEGLSGRGAGFGTAMNPMSLFGAPQVATVPQVDTSLPTPLAVTPAGGVLADVLPVEAPEGLPGALVAMASVVVAGTVAAHVAALRTRRAAVPA